MDIDRPGSFFGARIFGVGIMALGIVGLAWGDFVAGQPVSASFPGRALLACAAALLMLAAGAAMLSRRTMAWGAAAVAGYFKLIVVILMNGRVVLAHYAEFQAYNGASEMLAVAAAALVAFAAAAGIAPERAARLTRIGQIVFGLCAIVFGAAHFVYMNLTAPLVPAWLPPSQLFWGYATGVFHIAAGVAILTGVKARLAAILLTVMYASFSVLVHAPLAMAHPASAFVWAENALNLALTGCTWIMADSFARPSRKASK